MRVHTLTKFELRRRIDTIGAASGTAALTALIVASAVLGSSIGAGRGSLVLSEIIAISILPSAISIPMISVVTGAADATHRGDRSQILAGASRTSILLARLSASMLASTAVLIWSVTVASVVVVTTAVISGLPFRSGDLPGAFWGAVVLVYTSALFGLALGALLRSVAAGVIVVVLVTFVLDTATLALPAWTQILRFSSLQNALLGEGGVGVGAGTCAFTLWILLPATGAVIRMKREES
ncbi:hypothetical protein [Curtobacterium sp. Leaf261]|uniref:hypothetical protein n=1 Tax=Curtobacterium sp. Leaf261 TaxID=1736311 RepID=UPI0006FFFFAC|nr:hypothetical protein [Curtobacterium sp. Leaf261]KQO63595.1 hypothetical protein ASF23_05015 [Curtobacterium sp. Leaf261]